MKLGDPSVIYNSPEEIKYNLYQTVHIVVNCYKNLGVGMYCVNSENPAGCFDYQARFCYSTFLFGSETVLSCTQQYFYICPQLPFLPLEERHIACS